MRDRIARRVAVGATAILLAGNALSGPVMAQCAMCGSAAGAADVARGLSISILFLLGVVGLVVAGLLILSRRAAQRDGNRARTGS